MNNRFNTLALAATAVFALGLGATSASAAPVTAVAVAKAKVLKQLTIAKNSDLDFGTIVTGIAASTVTVNAAGALTCGIGLTCSQTPSAAKFTVTGTNNAIVTVSVPASVTLNSGTNTMTALLTVLPTLNLGSSGNTGTALTFGGTLNVGAGQADGVYASPDFAVTVDYQ